MIKKLLSIFKVRRSIGLSILRFNTVPLLQHVEVLRPDGTVLHIYRRL